MILKGGPNGGFGAAAVTFEPTYPRSSIRLAGPGLQISALEWNQDEEYGGFGGPHCMVVGGYGTVFSRMASLLDVRLNTPVTEVRGSVKIVNHQDCRT